MKRVALVLSLVLAGAVLGAAPADAQTVYLKLKAEPAEKAPSVKLTVNALSRVPVELPAQPVVYVDEGEGFKPRPELECRLANTPSGLHLEADRAVETSCELPLEKAGKVRVRVAYKVRGTWSTSNTRTLELSAPGPAVAGSR